MLMWIVLESVELGLKQEKDLTMLEEEKEHEFFESKFFYFTETYVQL